MKKIFVLALSFLGMTSLVFAEPEVLTPKQGGTPNKVFIQKERPKLKVATYNMGAARVSNIETVSKAVKALAQDNELIALNEVDIKTKRTGEVDQLAVLKEQTGYHGVFGRAIDFDGGQYGVAILSKYPIVKSQVFMLPSGDDEQRVLLVVEVNKPGYSEPILFMTTHLDWHLDPTLRIQQVREIGNIVLGNTDSDFSEIETRVKILAGDFNDGIGSTVFQELGLLWDIATVPGQDTRTWPAVNPAQDLDHVFTFKAQRWAVDAVETPNHNAITKDIDWPKTSDHVPAIVHLSLIEQ